MPRFVAIPRHSRRTKNLHECVGVVTTRSKIDASCMVVTVMTIVYCGRVCFWNAKYNQKGINRAHVDVALDISKTGR
jgi:hypothetical protein